MLLPLYNDFRSEADELTTPEQRIALEQILDCRAKRGVDICSSCKVYDDCNSVKDYLKRYGPKSVFRPPAGGTP